MTTGERILIAFGVLILILIPLALYAPRKGGTPAPEPQPNDSGWLTETANSASFRYPSELPTTYIRPVEWPPQISVSEGQFSCISGASEMGETKEMQIQEREYCVTTESEGAAGSVYTDYTYTIQKDDRSVSLSFALRMPQCANYDDSQKTECEQERSVFSPDDLADRILHTVELR